QSGGLNVAITRGGVPHMSTELFRRRSGADLTYVFYPGSSQAMSDVISGRVPIIVDGLGGPIAGGQLKLLAIASAERVALHSDIPTVAETLPGFVATGWVVLVKKISDDLNAVLARAEVRQKLNALGVSTRQMSPQQLSEFIHREQELWNPVVKQIGI